MFLNDECAVPGKRWLFIKERSLVPDCMIGDASLVRSAAGDSTRFDFLLSVSDLLISFVSSSF